jgi:hypothetical protein
MDRQALRALTLADNFEWLRSFGCTVEERGGMTFVDHPSLSDYEAWLFTSVTPESLQQLRRVMRGDPSGARAVYIDDDVASAEVRQIVGAARATTRNVTVAAQIADRQWRSPMMLQAAAPDDWEAWAEIYSRGFGRQDNVEIDRERWRLSFGSELVQHWFFVEHGARIGVCQTTRGKLHGIYSFTILPEARGFRPTLHALRALMAFVARQPSRWVYFEVLNHSPLARTRVQSAIGLINVRTLAGYELPVVKEG